MAKAGNELGTSERTDQDCLRGRLLWLGFVTGQV